jgi:hypothetical protein
MNEMKKILLASVVVLAGLSATVGTSSAAGMAGSKYCMSNGYDPLCMSAKMMKMRMQMMKMTKDVVMKNRSNYCMTNGDDPICNPKMMNSTKGF